jgi:hypothetical protein
MKNEPENDIVLGGIDQFLPIGKPQQAILNRVDEVMEEAVEKKNPDIAFDAMKGLLGVSQVSGLAFAKFIYVMSFQWKAFGRRGTFEENAEEEFGRKKVTIKRNYQVWEMLVSGDIPKEYAEKLKTMPIRCLIPIATMWKQGWEVETDQWMKLANAPDPSTVNKIIREIKKVEPKEGSLQLEWDVDTKTVTGWKNGEPHPIYLQYDENDPVIPTMLARLFGDGKALEK